MNTKPVKSAVACVAVCAVVASCSVARSLKYWYPDIDDHKIFRSVAVEPSATPFTFHEGSEEMRRRVADLTVTVADTLDMPLGEYLDANSTTTAFLVIRNDTILFENYYRGYDRTRMSTVFSVSKSVTSLLAGIAVTEGHIESVHDPVTRYVPELARRDPRWNRLTVEHLLEMRSGFKFNETYSGFLSKSAALYYGTNSMGKMKRMRFENEPGTGDVDDTYNYQSATATMLGLVVQRATGRNLADYMQDKVWGPLGMENRATWSVDDRRHRMAKADCGLNVTARDLAKIARLYLHGGVWNGTRIVDAAWVARTVTPNPANGGYQYQWYSDDYLLSGFPDNKDGYWPDRESAEAGARSREEKYPHRRVFGDGEKWWVQVYLDKFYALGLMQQVVYVDPVKKLIMVRLGEDGDRDYSTMCYRLAQKL